MKHTKEMYVHLYKYDKSEYVLYDSDMSEFGHIPVCKQVIEFETPDDFDPTGIQIAMLSQEIQKAEKEFSERVMKLKEEIGKLQALTYEVQS